MKYLQSILLKYCTFLTDTHLEYIRMPVNLQENDGQPPRKMGNGCE